MTDPERRTGDPTDQVLYPNAEDERRRAGVSRRRLLAGSMAAGVAATAGCTGSESGSDGDDAGRPTVFVFNTGDATVSVIDARTDELLTTQHVGLSSSFPSNQFTPELVSSPDDSLWLNVGRGVRAVSAGRFREQVRLETGSGANWLERTPDGRHVVVSAREPVHRQFLIDADPTSETFGEVTAELDRSDEDGTGDDDGPGPCDVSIHPDGRYAYVPDIFGDTLTVIDIETFEIVSQTPVDPVGDGPARPWMGTVAWNGETLLVENNEGSGTESIWDLSDPTAPEERVRLTTDDGLGSLPLTNEIGPDSEVGYVFTPDSEDITVVDLVEGTVERRIDLGGSAFVGTWDPAREKLYVPVQTANEVAVVDHATRAVTTRISVGARPYGATAATVRPTFETASDLRTALASMGVTFADSETTYCIGNCACGHRLDP